MKRIDHIAIVVENTVEAARWYEREHSARIEYVDDSWSLVSFENVKLYWLN